MKRSLLWLVACLLLAMGAIPGFHWWRSKVLERTGNATLHEAETAIKEGRGADALNLLERTEAKGTAPLRWQDLEVKASAAALQVGRLMAIYERQPDRIGAHEDAALLVYRGLCARGEREPAAALAARWKEKSSHPESWILQISDALTGEGKGIEAKKLLDQQSGWRPLDEVPRQLRLALLEAPSDMNAAFARLGKACLLDPKNADIRSFRAQIWESAGRIAEARVEYVAALVAEPGNALRRDQLAEFYLRQGDYDQAVPTWLEAAPITQADFMEAKGRFWAHVVHPGLAAKFTTTTESAGPWRRALDAMELAPPGKWLAPIAPADSPALTQHGELWWLELLDLIQSGDESALGSALAAQPARASAMAPDLSAALKTVLALRAKRPLENILWPPLAAGGSRPAFFIKLEALTQAARTTPAPPNAETLSLVRHPGCLAWIFASAGWREAGLRLQAWKTISDVPDPMLYTIAMCWRLNRGPAEVPALLAKRSGALLRGLAAECLIASGKLQAGLQQMGEAAAEDSGAGRRAGWLLCLAFLEQREFAAAKATLNSTPALASTPEGLEIAAKLALAANQPEEATRIYRLAAQAGSAEGGTWLLREAVKAGDSHAASEASMKLREVMPDEIETRANQLLLPAPPPK